MKPRKVYRRNLFIFWTFTIFVLLNALSNLLGLWVIWNLSGYFIWLICAPWTWFHALYTIKVAFENRKEESMKTTLFKSVLVAICILFYAVLAFSGILTTWWYGWIL